MVSVSSTIDTGHDDMIHDAQMDYYGTKLATASSDRSVKIFEVKGQSQHQIAELKGHEGPVWQVDWAHPKYGNLLASAGYDRKIFIWKEDENSGSWNKIYEYNGHDSSVNSVNWAGHELGLILAAGSSDGSISVITYNNNGGWDVEKINNAHTIGCNSVSWEKSPSNIKRFVSGGCDSLVKLWRYVDEQGWIEEAKLESHSDWVRDVAWAPSIGLQKNVIASCSQDRRVIIWTGEGGNGATWTPKILNTFDDVVWHVSWSVSGNMLAVSGGDNKVSLWKETMEGEWVCISNVNKGQSATAQG